MTTWPLFFSSITLTLDGSAAPSSSVATSATLVCLALTLLALFCFRESNNNKNGDDSKASSPSRICDVPSPPGYPLLGHLPLLGRYPYESMTELGKGFDGLFQLRFAHRNVVVLDTHETISEANSDLKFAGRPHVLSFQVFLNSGKSRIGFQDVNAKWKFLRKMTIRSLSLFTSLKRNGLQETVTEAVENFAAEIRRNGGAETPFLPQAALGDCVAAISMASNMGIKFNKDDQLVTKLTSSVKLAIDFLEVGTVMDNIPFGAFFFRRRIDRFLKDIAVGDNLVSTYLAQQKPVSNKNQIRSLADALEFVATNLATEDQKRWSGCDEETIKLLSQDFFLGSFEGILDSTHWLLNLMAANQDVQERVHAEIDSCLGTGTAGTAVTLEHRHSMPYTEAVVLESLRFVTIGPIGVPHATIDDINFRECYLPKGTMVINNFWAANHDARMFPEPFRFWPERFLTEEGSLNPLICGKVLAFAAGKRRCPGETLTRQTLFLFFTGLLQRFRVQPTPGKTIDCGTCQPGFFRRPYNHKLVFEQRVQE